jgi:hypothetical protein
MKRQLLVWFCALACAPWLAMAESPSEPGEDALFEILRDTTGGKPRREVTVVLEDEGKPVAPPRKTDAAAVEKPSPQKPSEPTGLVAVTPAMERKDPQKGVAVRVETLQTGETPIDPKQVKLLAPFPAKPLSDPPAGWKLDASGNAPAFVKEVELTPGVSISLSIKPHVLTTAANGSSLFSVGEPGFDSALGYQQTRTLGSILSTSIEQLDESSKRMGDAIDHLQQLLVSLPAPAAETSAPLSSPPPALRDVQQPVRKR